jgi:cell division septation protein DedD
MRYTSEASMEQQGLRDVDRWKDKIEVRLDNRQVAFLFFGSALVACLLFVLGVIVGKRLESRGRALAPEIEDPLALLDRVATTSPPRREEPVAVAPPPPARVPAPARAERPAPPAPVPTPPPPAPAPHKVAAVPPPAAPAVRPEAAVSAATLKQAPGGKARFMLQVGSFPDRAEAEAFAGSFPGEKPIVVVSEIPGKGTWYRVRLGSFQVFKEAVDAKMIFEKRYSKIALVVGPL